MTRRSLQVSVGAVAVIAALAISVVAGATARTEDRRHTVAFVGELTSADGHVAVADMYEHGVQVFRRDGGELVLEAEIAPPTRSSPPMYFGYALALVGDTLAVGAPGDDVGDWNTGSVYVYRRVDGSWNHVQTLQAADATNGQGFGSSVALSSSATTLVAGAPAVDTHPHRLGAAYVFDLAAEGYAQVARLDSAAGQVEDRFGNAVAIAGRSVVVGAHEEDHSGRTDVGAVYVYPRTTDGEVGDPQRLAPPTAARADVFGNRIAASGGVIVVSESGDDDNGPQAGAAHVYRNVDGSWAGAQLKDPDAGASQYFGASVAVRDCTIVIGSADDEAGETAGAAYVFQQTRGGYPLMSKLVSAVGDLRTSPIIDLDDDVLLAGVGGERDGFSGETVREPAIVEYDEPTGCPYDPAGDAGSVYRLYRAYFQREPDRHGYLYWLDARRSGLTAVDVSASFAQSAEFRSRYGSVDNKEFVRLVYQNVLGREPDTSGYEYWTSQMARGMSRGFVMIYFSDSEEYRAKTSDGVPPGYRAAG